MKARFLSVFLALLIATTCIGCSGGTEESSNSDLGSSAIDQLPSDASSLKKEDAPDLENTVTLNGKTFRKRTDLRTVLFLGIDDTQTVEAEGAVLGNQGRADSVVLFILDKTAKTTTSLLISRNTMTEVDVYKANGDLATSNVMQLNMQYAFGNSPTRGNFLMKRTVSELLYNTKIDSCVSMTMEGIAVVVDGMGGITLTLPEDFTDIDPSYTKGTTVIMDGKAAERFVRYRDTEILGSAEDRMDRQNWFVHTLFQQMKAQGNMREQLEKMLDAADGYIEMDLDAETIKQLASYEMLDETEKVPGTTKAGKLHDEFYVDEEALKELLVELFYEPVD